VPGAGDRSIGQVARDFDLTETNVRTWVKQPKSTRAAPGADDRGSVKSWIRLRRQVRRLEIDNETLKRATSFFARETR